MPMMKKNKKENCVVVWANQWLVTKINLIILTK